MKQLNVLVIGNGQMGEAVTNELQRRNHHVVARVGSSGDEKGRSLVEILDQDNIDIAIEFSLPHAAKENVLATLQAKIPVVCGTTGWQPQELESTAIENNVPLLHAANFSIGVAVMKKAAEIAAKSFRPFSDFEPAIFERHHNRKKDAPSGTANMIGQVVADHSGMELDELQITSVRQGQVAGEHTLIFEGAAESLEIVHRAHSRQIFAIGAVLAAEWLSDETINGLVDFETFLTGSTQWKAVV